MSAKVISTDDGSISSQLGIKQGDVLETINGNEISDVIDYMFYSECEDITLGMVCGGQKTVFELEKDAYEPLGMNFETYLIDEQRCCKNKCIFCFIDQLPKGLRETMYFKDDDSRLSFLMGNYITLTNLSDKDLDRICKMRISPINVSVHTTDPKLRVRMMKNPNAAKINDQLSKLARSGVTMNCQIVLCKNFNDGDNLRRTLSDLEKLYPAVASCSVVPVGLTKFRDGLEPLEPFEKDDCREVLSIINEAADKCREKYGVRLFYASDEFYLKGEVGFPPEYDYDGYPQIENGVGLSVSLLTEVESAVADLEYSDEKTECAIITGVLPATVMQRAVDMIKTKRPALDCKIYRVINHFFGEKITVAGLVTATDIIEQLSDVNLPERTLIPCSMLRSEQDMFLDSITLEQTESRLGCKLTTVFNNGYDLVKKILGESEEQECPDL